VASTDQSTVQEILIFENSEPSLLNSLRIFFVLKNSLNVVALDVLYQMFPASVQVQHSSSDITALCCITSACSACVKHMQVSCILDFMSGVGKKRSQENR